MNQTEKDAELFREFTLTLSTEDSLEVVGILDEGDAVQGLSGYYEVLYDEERPSDGRTSLVLYFPLRTEQSRIQLELLLAALGISDYSLMEKPIHRLEYLEAYKKYYVSFRIGERFLIVPSWERGETADTEGLARGLKALYLDPGLAFGTGQHPTTRLCLSLLESRIEPGMRIIDAGCGSGILGIGALLLGASSVFAFDVDGNALTAVRQNLDLNPAVTGRMELEQGGFELPSFQTREADLLVANITQNIIFSNSRFINAGRYPRMILSGILTEGREEVKDHFSELWEPVSEGEDEGWVVLEFVRRDGV